MKHQAFCSIVTSLQLLSWESSLQYVFNYCFTQKLWVAVMCLSNFLLLRSRAFKDPEYFPNDGMLRVIWWWRIIAQLCSAALANSWSSRQSGGGRPSADFGMQRSPCLLRTHSLLVHLGVADCRADRPAGAPLRVWVQHPGDRPVRDEPQGQGREGPRGCRVPVAVRHR
jgi:hypothetical protein